MTASVNIKRGDLHLLVSAALNRGRYVLMTGGGDGQPIEITLDLRERPDDLFGAEWVGGFTDIPARDTFTPTHEDIGVWRPFNVAAADGPSDDHGPAIPAQKNDYRFWTDETKVYEFAVQDVHIDGVPLTRPSLDEYGLDDAPNRVAAAKADWVHVYDRVTRERRTLKRPEPDEVLTGLRDVAADLRGKRGWAVGDIAQCIIEGPKQPVGRVFTVTDVDQAGGFLGFDGNGACWMMSRFEHYRGPLGHAVDTPPAV